MTALKRFQRLESIGIWNPGGNLEQREVVVTFGHASLVISDTTGQPLVHWSLAAIRRLNPRQRPALFAPTTEADETLEIEDPTMIEAVETIRKAITGRRPHHGRVRLVLSALLFAALAAAGGIWLPDMLAHQAARLVPPSTHAQLSAHLLRQIAGPGGGPCTRVEGQAALNRLLAALPPDPLGQAQIMSDMPPHTLHLPDGTILLSAALLHRHEDPEVIAGFILAERARAAELPPLVDLQRNAGGLRASAQLLTSGSLPPEGLNRHAQILLHRPPEPPEETMLLSYFEAADVASSPYGYALDPSGESTLALIEADPMRGKERRNLISDSDWLRLQGICGN